MRPLPHKKQPATGPQIWALEERPYTTFVALLFNRPIRALRIGNRIAPIPMMVKPGSFSEGWQGITFITPLECHHISYIIFIMRQAP